MKIRIVIILILFVNGLIFCQLPCPLKSGTVILFRANPDLHFYRHPDETRDRIQSENEQVVSISDGKVVKIMKSDSDYSLIIRSDHNDFFVYSNLFKTALKVNDKVEKDQLLGVANYDEHFASFVLDFQFWKGTEPIKVELNCKKPN